MKKRNVYAVILAGGSGTRFWPLSRRSKPKQFLNLTGEGTLLALTLKRLRRSVSGSRIIIVANKQFRSLILKEGKRHGVLAKNILLEPSGKNTAPAVLWAALHIRQSDPQAIIAVFPSDHLILKTKAFMNVLRQAIRLAEREHLVTFGIKPTRSDTGFGYLKVRRGKTGLKVERFIEKPNLNTANKFVRQKIYLWNSGMFVFSVSSILKAYQKYLPKAFKIANQRNMKKIWSKLPSISVDYGIFEKANNVYAVSAANIGWSDLGSWDSLLDLSFQGKKGNVKAGEVIDIDCDSNVLMGDKRLMVGIGLKNMIVIDRPDALLICHKGHSQKVRDVVKGLHLTKKSLL